MNRLKQKLKSESGVSFLFALLAFMLAAMVAAVVISAAVSALKSVYDDRQQEQAHLALVSAAQLVEEQIDDKTVEEASAEDTVKTTCTITETRQGATVVSGPAYTAEGTFQNEMLAVVKSVWESGLPYNADNVFSIDADLSGITSSQEETVVNVSIMASKNTNDDADDQNDQLVTVFKFQLSGTEDTIYLKMTATPGAPVSTIVTSGSKTNTILTTQFQWIGRGISDEESDLN